MGRANARALVLRCTAWIRLNDIWLLVFILKRRGFPGGSVVKNLPVSAGDTGDVGLIPGLGRYSGGENVNQYQYSFSENPMDKEA